ncbi:Triacylglycerol lipase protein [Dioscorea alata]|uniref:Triacylglycerol lipase protein n=1 Tax=Dioscorea alata TaxID=55571 RepID=A0ACB7VR90_DIOAL|nr:Triacylglycerol lipase protein [Dioscorea alata]
MVSKEYLMIHTERVRMLDMFNLVFSSKSLAEYGFVETNNINLMIPMNISTRLLILMSLFFSIISLLFSDNAKKFEDWLEYSLNKLSLNGGFFGLLRTTFSTGSLRRPDPEAANYRSLRSFESGQVELDKNLISSLKLAMKLEQLETSSQNTSLMMLAAFASNLAYENEARIKYIVNDHLQMTFVEYFKCWNVSTKAESTRAFICYDKLEDAELIILSFRGTSKSIDWKCNLGMSFMKMGEMGRVHLGFLAALGLQDRRDIDKGFPKEYNGNKSLAYYSIRKVLYDQLKKYKNAKILVTGHSLGGALAILYTSLLVMHEEHDILKRINWVLTFGQPRVGDASFGDTMFSNVETKYIRSVYRFDIVPRVPFDLNPFVLYKHFGVCINYTNWYDGKKVKEVANKNYFNVLYCHIMFWGAVEDFFRSLPGIWTGLNGFIETLFRLFLISFPGVAFHSMKNYINATCKAKHVAP